MATYAKNARLRKNTTVLGSLTARIMTIATVQYQDHINDYTSQISFPVRLDWLLSVPYNGYLAKIEDNNCVRLIQEKRRKL